jgi:hypothetical protein
MTDIIISSKVDMFPQIGSEMTPGSHYGVESGRDRLDLYLIITLHLFPLVPFLFLLHLRGAVLYSNLSNQQNTKKNHQPPVDCPQ